MKKSMKYALILSPIVLLSISYAFLRSGVDCNSGGDCADKGSVILYFSGDCQKALEYFEEACDKYDNLHGCNFAVMCHEKLQNKSKAQKYKERFSEIARKPLL